MFLGISWVQWLGYLGSVIIAISMLMSSILMLRWINMVGAFLFTIYGLCVLAWPVVFLDTFIVLVNVYHLHRIYTQREYFTTLKVSPNSAYLAKFLDFYKKDIVYFFPEFSFSIDDPHECFFLLRNMTVAALFIGHCVEEGTLHVDLDFAVPEYRDFKLGNYLYAETDYLQQRGIHTLVCESNQRLHQRYLRKMGFTQDNGWWTKRLKPAEEQA